jgi:hypothetical protein
MLKLKAQNIPILVELQTDSVVEGGMPGNGQFLFCFGRFVVDKPSSCKETIVKKTTAGNGELRAGSARLLLTPYE